MARARGTDTRRELVRAASEEVAEKGFHSASVNAIARRAGFSIGALYGNFRDKDDLLFAVFDEHVAWFDARLREVAEAEDQGAAGAAWIAEIGREREQFLIFIEFWAYAVRQPEMRERLAERLAQLRAKLAEVMGEDVALIALATARGLAIEKLADPAAVDAKLIENLAGMAFAATRQAGS